MTETETEMETETETEKETETFKVYLAVVDCVSFNHNLKSHSNWSLLNGNVSKET